MTEDDVSDEEFAATLDPGETLVEGVPKPPRFYCAGAKRVDPHTEKKVCDYRAYQRWYGPCPKCSHWYGCLPYRKSKNAKRQVTLADAANAKPLTYYPTGIEGLDHVLGGGFVLERTLFLGGPQGLGKPLACDTPVPTPTGWSTQGELRAGDEVIGADGRAARVLGTTGPMHGKKCYRLTFSDGTTIVADEDHPWPTLTAAERVGDRWSVDQYWPRTRTTREISGSLVNAWGEVSNHSIEPAFGPLARRRMPPEAHLRRFIVSVVPVDSVPVCCIQTDRPDGLYVVGRQWVVTHNTSLLLQAADGFAQHGRKAYFASAEMTQKAVLDYAHRLQITNPNVILFADSEGIEVRDLFDAVMEAGAKLIIGDSLQVLRVDDVEGDVGEPTMMNAVVNMMSSFCQEKHVASVLISHLNKEGELAGARKAAYLSDGILRLEPRVEYDEDGRVVRGTGGLREICWDGKSRQSRVDLTALVEMDDVTGRTGKLSPDAVRAMSKLMR